MERKEVKIICHTHRQPGIKYIEDEFTQAEICKMKKNGIIDYCEKHDLTVYTCYDRFINNLGCITYHDNQFYKAYDFIVCWFDDEGEHQAHLDAQGYVYNWPIGYFDGMYEKD